jgi:hypothetical protein
MNWTGVVLLLVAFGCRSPEAARARSEPATGGLVAHWTFDEGGGDVTRDVTGNGHGARLHGARTVPDGDGRALLLEAKEAYADAGVAPGFQTAAGGAFSLWLMPRKLQGGLVNWSKGSGWTDIRLTLAFNTFYGGNDFLVSVSDGRSFEGIALPVPPLDRWTHMAVSFSGPNLTVFVNGAPAVSRSVNCVPERTGIPLWIGRCEGLGEACFAGLIDEVRIFDRPLGPAEVLAQYKTAAQGKGQDTGAFDTPAIEVLPMPDAGRIVVSARCALMQPLPAGAVLHTQLTRGGAVLSRQALPIDAGASPMILQLAAADLAAGEYQVAAVVRTAFRRAFGRPATTRVNWPGRAAEFAGVKVLNNVVWELLRTEPGAVSGMQTASFSSPRRRWCYYAVTAEVGAGGTLRLAREEAPEDTLISLVGPASTTAEAMRPLAAGRHRLVLSASGPCVVTSLVVRSIPELVYADYFCEPHVKEHGPYVGAFLDRYILPNVNTSIISGSPADRPEIRRWLDGGGRWLNHCGVPRSKAAGKLAVVNVAAAAAGATPEPITGADAVAYIGGTLGFGDPRFTGAIADEFGDSEPLCSVYAEAVRMLARDSRFSGRLFYPYANRLYTGPEGIDLVKALAETGSVIAWKNYLKTQADADAARSFLQAELVDAAWGYRKAVPNALEHIDVCFGIFSAPNEFLNTNPGVDYRTYLDMQFRLVANDPAFWGTYGLMSYLASYSDEETLRWVAALMRHYGIEGRTEPLTQDPYDLPHMVNGDFAQGTQGWTLALAAPGSIRTDRKEKFGWLQGRYPPTPEGDTVLVLTRDAAKPNVFSQEIKALEPGRLYSFRMFSADFDDMGKEERHALTVTLDGVELIPRKCFTHVGHNCYSHHAGPYDAKNRAWFNYHWRVFRATGTTARLTVSDWAAPDAPGGPVGLQIMCNFAHVRPYLPDGTE